MPESIREKDVSVFLKARVAPRRAKLFVPVRTFFVCMEMRSFFVIKNTSTTALNRRKFFKNREMKSDENVSRSVSV
jgi:hypothetical protein